MAIAIPGFQLRVLVKVKGQEKWLPGICDTTSCDVQTGVGTFKASQVRAIRHAPTNGEGTRVPLDEIRSSILLLAICAGMPRDALAKLAKIGTEPKD